MLTVNTISSCSLLITGWLQDHLLPCPFKYLTGIDCPGCGFQRAVLALIGGNVIQSFVLYPPAIPLLLFFAFGLADKFLKIDDAKGRITKTMFIVVAGIVVISYSIKMFHIYQHYSTSV